MLIRGDIMRDPRKHFFPLPNEVWALGLDAGEIAVYAYLMYKENRKTFSCYPSYSEIANAIGRNKRTIPKYVNALVEKRLIEVGPTTITLADGTKRNGTLRYTLLPIREAVRYRNEVLSAKNAGELEKLRIMKHLDQESA